LNITLFTRHKLIKNIIFDLGNVLLNFKPEEFLLRFTNDRKLIKKFISNVIRSRTWLKLDRGIITVQKAREKFLLRYPDNSNLINLFFDHWTKMFTPIEKNIEILRDLKKNGYKLYILSNYIEEAFDYVNKKYEFFSLFDGGIISYRIQIIKPEMEMFKKIINEYNLNPQECVFIDDIATFLLKPRKLKMNTIQYRPNTDLRKELRNLKINV